MAKKKIKTGNIITLVIMCVIMIALIVGDVVCSINAQAITNLLCGTGLNFEGEEVEEAMAVSDELVQDIADESIILLKNDNDTLPLKSTQKKLNLFGWGATDKGFVLTGHGSGAARISAEKKVTLSQGLKASGFEINETLLEKFVFKNGNNWMLTNDKEDAAFYDEMMPQAKEYSDTAIVVFTRFSGENQEVPYTNQNSHNWAKDTTRTHLELSKGEEMMINKVKNNFGTVIVIFACSNPMEMGFVEDSKIDAVLSVGMLGQSGTKAIGRILKGDVNPSGKTADTHPYDQQMNPSWANDRRDENHETNGVTLNNHVHYVENIYVGYKWWETAAVTGYYDSVSNAYGTGYDGVVQFPFGYGLSYTDFTWTVKSVSTEGQQVTSKKTEITVEVEVKNVGEVAGKDVVQVYATPPYYTGQIEKAHVNLMAFEKTKLLEPNESETLTLTFDLYDIASYDSYDKNENGSATYELDAGTYHIKVMDDAHTLAACEKADTTFELPNALRYKLDPVTKRVVKNRFTGESAYAGVPVDGNTEGNAYGSFITYLSRADFAGTFPKTRTPNRNESLLTNVTKTWYTGYDDEATMPVTNVDKGMRLWTKADGSNATLDDLKGQGDTDLKFNKELALKLANYNAPEWDDFLNQISLAEMKNLVESSGYGTDAILSVGKAFNREFDGPSGFQPNYGAVADDTFFTGFPSEINIAATWNKKLSYQFGRAIAQEGNATGLSGWYAPEVNLHRSPFSGRYFEMYSEDSVLSGIMASQTIMGAKSLNTYCFLKHFALSEAGINPTLLYTWLPEQALRETYLKPFEIAVKKGEANAIMSAFNRVGPIWAGGSKPLLTDILRNEWGFRGVVLTDWSTGDGYMNTQQGIRAGNDMWLNPNDVNGIPLRTDNVVEMSRARNACKNMLYTICDTYSYFQEASEGQDITMAQTNKVFAWWIPLLVGINVIVVGIIVWQAIVVFVPFKKKEHAAK